MRVLVRIFGRRSGMGVTHESGTWAWHVVLFVQIFEI